MNQTKQYFSFDGQGSTRGWVDAKNQRFQHMVMLHIKLRE